MFDVSEIYLKTQGFWSVLLFDLIHDLKDHIFVPYLRIHTMVPALEGLAEEGSDEIIRRIVLDLIWRADLLTDALVQHDDPVGQD